MVTCLFSNEKMMCVTAACWDDTDFWPSPGFGTEALVPEVSKVAVLLPRFWFLLLGTKVSVQSSQGVICIFSFCY